MHIPFEVAVLSVSTFPLLGITSDACTCDEIDDCSAFRIKLALNGCNPSEGDTHIDIP